MDELSTALQRRKADHEAGRFPPDEVGRIVRARLMTLAAKQLREWHWIATYSTHVLDLAVMNGHDPTGTLAKVIAELERITKDTPVVKPQPDTVDPAIFRSEEA